MGDQVWSPIRSLQAESGLVGEAAPAQTDAEDDEEGGESEEGEDDPSGDEEEVIEIDLHDSEVIDLEEHQYVDCESAEVKIFAPDDSQQQFAIPEDQERAEESQVLEEPVQEETRHEDTEQAHERAQVLNNAVDAPVEIEEAMGSEEEKEQHESKGVFKVGIWA